MMRKIVILLSLCALLFSCDGGKPKYVFLIIADGLGTNHSSLVNEYCHATKKDSLLHTSFPYSGFVATHPANGGVTCSSAAGTAIATGKKTNNSMVGIDPVTGEAYESIAEKLKKQGWNIGLITSVSIDHATPASFYANEKSRGNAYAIAYQGASSNFDFIGGSGFGETRTEGEKSVNNLYRLYKENGYVITSCKDSVSEKTLMLDLKGNNPHQLTNAIDADESDMSLLDLTDAAIEALSKNGKPFFMMIEGGTIDWASHGNDGKTMVDDVLALNECTKSVFDFYKKHPKETLIIYTADHETGGLIYGAKGIVDLGLLDNQISSQGKITQKLKKLRKEKASWEDVKELLTEELGFYSNVKITDKEDKELKRLYEAIFIQGKELNSKSLYADDNMLVATAIKMLNTKAGISWASGSHSGGNVPVFSVGVGAEEFTGLIDNTDIYNNVAKILGVK